MAKKNVGGTLANVLVVLSVIIFAILVLPSLFKAFKGILAGGARSSGSGQSPDTPGKVLSNLGDALKNAVTGKSGGGAAGGGSASRLPTYPTSKNTPSTVPFISAGPSLSDLRPWEFIPEVAPVTTFTSAPTGAGTLQEAFDRIVGFGNDGSNVVQSAVDLSGLGFDGPSPDALYSDPAEPIIDFGSIGYGDISSAVNEFFDSFFSFSPDISSSSDSGYQDNSPSSINVLDYQDMASLDYLDQAYVDYGGDQQFYY